MGIRYCIFCFTGYNRGILNHEGMNKGDFWLGVDERIREIVGRYANGDFSIWACGDGRPGEEKIVSFEKEFGVRLPGDFRELSLSKFGGFHIEVKESIWPRPEAYAVGPHWTFLYGFYVYGFGKELDDWMEIGAQTRELRKETGCEIVPCLKVICEPDFYCFDSGGKLYQWDCELDGLNPVERSFLEMFEEEMRQLRERKDKKKGSEKA